MKITKIFSIAGKKLNKNHLNTIYFRFLRLKKDINKIMALYLSDYNCVTNSVTS